MNYISIGGSALQTSQLVLGCMRMAQLTIEQAQEVIATSLDSGINFFDHADIYGKGESERIFAQALQQLDVPREQLYLQSKCGIRPGYFDFSFDHIVSSVDGILERLNTDYLDVLLLHRPDALVEPDEVAEAFTVLEKSGKVRYFGVSNHNPMQIQLLQNSLPMPLIANQLQFGPAHTPMIDAGLNVNMWHNSGAVRDGSVLDYCRLANITVQPWSPFQVDLEQGLFMSHPNYQTLTQTLQRMAQEKGTTLEAIVMAWIVRHPAIMQPVVGSMNVKRIQEMSQGISIELTRQEWYDIYRSAGNVLP